MAGDHVLAIDQGTTGTTVLVLNHDSEVVGRAYSEFTQHYPRPGWVEHDANEIWEVSRQVIGTALGEANVAARNLAAVSVTNQRETIVLWDRETGEPVHNAIVWQDRRTAEFCDELKEKGLEDTFRDKTGLVIDAYFSGTKVRWMLDNVEGLRERARNGEIAVGTIDSWMVWNLTGGQACYEPGLAKNTYGTGSFVLMNTGTEGVPSNEGLLTTIAWGIGDEPVEYALEGAVFITGAAVQWLRDGLGIIEDAAETEELAESIDSNDGVYFVPALVGLGAPHWDAYARGTIVGITRGNTRAHLARAALESIAYQARDVIESMERDSGIELKEFRADGGASVNAWLMQFQADILGVPVEVPEIMEATALGAAYLAGLATGFWESREELENKWKLWHRYEPQMDEEERERLYSQWQEALERAKDWIREEAGAPPL